MDVRKQSVMLALLFAVWLVSPLLVLLSINRNVTELAARDPTGRPYRNRYPLGGWAATLIGASLTPWPYIALFVLLPLFSWLIAAAVFLGRQRSSSRAEETPLPNLQTGSVRS